MSRYLTLGLLLVASVSGVCSIYSPVSIAFSGIQTMAASYQLLATAIGSYYTALNAGFNTLFPALFDLLNTMSAVYSKLNVTYGATQPNISSVLQTLASYNQSFREGAQMIDANVELEMSELMARLVLMNEATASLFGSTVLLMSTVDFDECVARNASGLINLANSLAKLAPCIQQQVNAVSGTVQSALGTIIGAKADFLMMNNQLSLCRPTSRGCINQYFNNLYSESAMAMSELNSVVGVIIDAQADFYGHNSWCRLLVDRDIGDKLLVYSDFVLKCKYPPPPAP